VRSTKRGRCPACAGTGEVEFTLERTLTGASVLVEARRILLEEAEASGLTVGDIVGPSRVARIIPTRHRTAKRLYDELDMKLTSIGRLLGGRDHSTIIYAIRRANGATWEEAHSA